MDRSIRKLPDPVSVSAHGERRSAVRQKLHTPVYASFNGPQAGMVVDLSELLDLHEDGFAIQTSEPLEMNRAVTLCLDLPETRGYVHGSGQVMWSDDAGRGGIRFSALSDSSRKTLKEWLFANLLIACSNFAARTGQLERRENEEENEDEKSTEPVPLRESSTVVSIADGSATLPSLETVRAKVLAMGDDVDAVLQLIAERALSLTASSGAALAFLSDDKMLCRARTGDPAPPLGATLDDRQGISGECVRSGRLLSCEDTEKDPRVDPEVCRTLGIGALMAAPIVSDFRVVGVLEVLSWHPRGFTKAHERALDQLVEMIPKIHNQSTQPDRAQSETPIKPEDGSVVAPPSASQSYSIQPGLIDSTSIHAIREALSEQKRQQKREQEDEVPEPVSQPVPGENPETAPASPARLLYRSLIGLSMAVAVTALGYVAGPAVKNWAESPRGAQSSTAVKAVNMAEAASTAPGQTTDLRPVDSSSVDFNLVVGGSANRSPQPKSLPELQKLADAGDADAQWQMGVRYHDGESVPHDDAQAVQWFHRSAEQGNVAAQGALGAYYWRGRGVPADLSKAYFWSTIAMAQGDEMSKSRIEGLSSQLAPAQVSAARQQAEVWIRTHNLRAQFGAN